MPFPVRWYWRGRVYQEKRFSDRGNLRSVGRSAAFLSPPVIYL
jgi:hypothetical protein